jgi:tetratricopeptide (TPR) repeat protein
LEFCREDWERLPMNFTGWRGLVGAANLLAVALFISPAFAQTQQQMDQCMNKDNSYSPDLRISGCTAAIRSGRWSGQRLAWALVGRCWAYIDNDKYEQAFADCNEAIRLDPNNALAYNNRC